MSGSGWGYPHRRTPFDVFAERAADALADAVEQWDKRRWVTDEERMTEALAKYKQARQGQLGRVNL